MTLFIHFRVFGGAKTCFNMEYLRGSRPLSVSEGVTPCRKGNFKNFYFSKNSNFMKLYQHEFVTLRKGGGKIYRYIRWLYRRGAKTFFKKKHEGAKRFSEKKSEGLRVFQENKLRLIINWRLFSRVTISHLPAYMYR